MTNSTKKASWPYAIGCYLAGVLLTVVLWISSLAVADHVVRVGLGAFSLQLFFAAVAGLSVAIALTLPRRARAMFVSGVLTPITLGALFFAWLIWAFSHSNFTF